MWRDLSFIRENRSLCFRLEISKMTSEVGKIKWDCPSTAHAHHIFENMTCLPGPTFIQGLWGVICSKSATIEVEISIKENSDEGEVEAELRGWSHVEFHCWVFSLYLYLYIQQLFLLLWLINFLWKSPFFYLLTSTIFAWFMWGVSFFFLRAQPLLLSRTACTPIQNLVWLSLCVGLPVPQNVPTPSISIQGHLTPVTSSGMDSWYKQGKKGLSPAEVVSSGTMWAWVSLPGSQGGTPPRYWVSVLLYRPLDLALWASSNISQYISFFFKLRVPVSYNPKRATLGLWRNVNFLRWSGAPFYGFSILHWV